MRGVRGRGRIGRQRRWLATWAVAAAAVVSSRPAMAIPVTFAADGVEVRAQLFRPRGAGVFPAVVALHGCDGLTVANGALASRYRVWAQKLVQRGFVVLFPDSFASRGVGPQCKTPESAASAVRAARERAGDAVAARRYLQSLRYVNASSVALLGWSNGGAAVLQAIGKEQRPVASGPDFARAVAFYPACRGFAEAADWHVRLPLAILIGAADDWTPAGPCEALASAAKARGEPVSITVYPGALHDFDAPDLPVHAGDGPTDVGGGRPAHSGTDPAARADAFTRVPKLLAP